jgi:hypothetical protein
MSAIKPNVVDRLYRDNRDLLDYLQRNEEISYRVEVDSNFRKTLLLSVASYFESIMKDILLDFFKEQTNKSTVVLSFIENKAIERQYHTYFNWEGNNANSFFGLFGEDFRDFMKKEVRTDNQLDESIRAFLKLGNTRNQLVHQNFASFSLENTAEEIYQLYEQAEYFVDVLPKKLREYVSLH